MNKKKKRNKYACISGGGADGGFTCGYIAETKPSYQGGAGVSTGALLILLTLIRKYGSLTDAYINATDDDIIEDSLFNDNGGVKLFTALQRFYKAYKDKDPSVTHSTALRKYIDEFIEEEDFEKGLKYPIALGVHSYSYKENLYVVNKGVTFEDFKDWMWISANVPGFMSTVTKARPGSDELEQWTDGGVQENVPLKWCLLNGADEVDVYMHSPKPSYFNSWIRRIFNKSGIQNTAYTLHENFGERKKSKNLTNPHETLLRVGQGVIKDSWQESLLSGLLLAALTKKRVRIIWMPQEFYDNAFKFGKDKMKHLYEEGKRSARKGDTIDIFDF